MLFKFLFFFVYIYSLPIHMNFLCFICIYFFIGCSIMWFRLISYVFFICFCSCPDYVSCLCPVHILFMGVLFMSCSWYISAHVLLICFCSYPAHTHILLIWIHIINYIYTLLVWILLMSCSCGLCSCPACMNSVHAQLMSSACEFCLCVSANANFLHVLLMWVPFISCSCRLCSCPIRMTSAHVLLMWALFKYIKTSFFDPLSENSLIWDLIKKWMSD